MENQFEESVGETTSIGIPPIQLSLAMNADRSLNAQDFETIDKLASGSALLISIHSAAVGTRYLLDEEETTAGRDRHSDIFLDDATVSRHHAIFKKEADHYTLIDAGSLNGTYVNQKRIENPIDLHTGDVIMIGRFKFLYYFKQ